MLTLSLSLPSPGHLNRQQPLQPFDPVSKTQQSQHHQQQLENFALECTAGDSPNPSGAHQHQKESLFRISGSSNPLAWIQRAADEAAVKRRLRLSLASLGRILNPKQVSSSRTPAEPASAASVGILLISLLEPQRQRRPILDGFSEPQRAHHQHHLESFLDAPPLNPQSWQQFDMTGHRCNNSTQPQTRHHQHQL